MSAETIRRIRQQTLALMEAITASPKPDYELDGQRVSWSEYLKRLQETVEWCNVQLAAEEPLEIRSQGYTP